MNLGQKFPPKKYPLPETNSFLHLNFGGFSKFGISKLPEVGLFSGANRLAVSFVSGRGNLP